MHLLDRSKIIIPDNRQRRLFDPAQLEELARSIKALGLLHPIVVRETGPDAYALVAGERRLRVLTALAETGEAIVCNNQLIQPGLIPATLLQELSPIGVMEAELEENTVRTNLTWQERALAQAQLHSLRLAQNPSQTIQATASEVMGAPAQGSQVTRVSEAITVARHLSDPDVAKAKTQDEAIKILRKKAESAKRVELAKTFDASATKNTAKQGDSRELIQLVPSGSIDVILTDPPYGISANGFGSQAATGHDYEDNPIVFNGIRLWLMDEAFRVAKPQAHMYMFCDLSYFYDITAELTFAGWWVWPRPLIWSKGNGMLPFPGKGPRYTYECIVYAVKGGRSVIFDAQPDVLSFPSVARPRHGAEKPVDLYTELLRRSCNPGDTVLDPFMGSGTIFPAANRLRLQATGFELNPESYALALTRINETELDADPVLNI